MKTKILRKFTYDGLGFPIKLEDVTMVYIDGEWAPKIDVRKIAKKAIEELPYQKERFSGNQIRFIRGYFEMSLREFASKVVNESHNAVAKWEKFESKPTNMDENIESMLRLHIVEQVSVKTKKQAQDFINTFRKIKEMSFLKKSPTPIMMKAV